MPIQTDGVGRATRLWVGALHGVQGAALGWAAWAVPWDHASAFSALTACVALAQGATAVVALAWPSRLSRLWFGCSALTILWLLAISLTALRGVLFLVASHGSLGAGLAGALTAVWAAFAFFSLPLALFGVVSQRACAPRIFTRRGVVLVCAVALLAALVDAYLSGVALASAAPLTASEVATLTAAAAAKGPATARLSRRAVACKGSPLEAAFTLFVHHERRRGRCFQGETRAAVIHAAEGHLRKAKSLGPVKLDWVVTRSAVGRIPRWVELLALRPGLDGLCAGKRCFAPWQLVSRGAFAKHRPLEFLPDLRLGGSLRALERSLARGKASGPAARFGTQSLLLGSNQKALALSRLHPSGGVPAQALGQRLEAGVALAEGHVLAAQNQDGTFRYQLDPFSGKSRTKNFNLARQAGTTLALCELGDPGAGVDSAARRALLRLVRFERVVGGEPGDVLSGLARAKGARRLRLADSALALVALLGCRPRLGPELDETIARLTRLVLRLQRRDGRFAPGYLLAKARVGPGRLQPGPEPLYVSGQAMLALVLVEQSYDSLQSGLGISRARIREAIDRTMAHVATSHWSPSLYPFFFLEENWHCIAAHRALTSHPHAGYQRFCLDYVRFKSRLILDDTSRVDPAFVGGFGFGNVVVPHTAAAAGFGEALAAAVHVARARGESTAPLETKLRLLVHYLLRQQWQPETAFAVAPAAFGGFSESLAVGEIRIDYVQHAWSALAQGGRALRVL